jgi:hypothetical protein
MSQYIYSLIQHHIIDAHTFRNRRVTGHRVIKGYAVYETSCSVLQHPVIEKVPSVYSQGLRGPQGHYISINMEQAL